MDECGIHGIVRTEDTISGALHGSDSIKGHLQAEGVLIGKVGFPKCGNWYDEYEGDYELTPKTYAQMLDTDNKLMRDDVTVLSIPYYETSNTSGTTVYIGSEV